MRSSPGATGIHDLPPELLDWVFSYADRVDLLNLSLVSKPFAKLVAARLYSEYINTNLQYRRSITSFLLRVLQDADLARHVRRVELGVWNTKPMYLHPAFRKDVPALPDALFESLAVAAKQSRLVSQDRDYRDLRLMKKNKDLWCEYGPTYDSDGFVSDDLGDFDLASYDGLDSDEDNETSSESRPDSPESPNSDPSDLDSDVDAGDGGGGGNDSDGHSSDLSDETPDGASDYGTPTTSSPSHPSSKRHDDVEFLRCLKRGLEDPQVILLLSKLPRLRELSLRGPQLRQGLSWDRLCAHSLRSLTKLKVAGTSGDAIWDMAELNAVVRLPSLRKLHGYMATSDEGHSDYLQVEPKSISLTHIYLERCALGPKTMASLIRGCKALEAFSYVAGGQYVGHWQFCAVEVKDHLLKHKETLKYLALDLSRWQLSRWDSPGRFSSFKSMADFTSLEKVAMDYGTLRWKPALSLMPTMGEENGDAADDGDIHAANTQPPLPDLLPSSLVELVIFQAPPVIVENLVAFETSSRSQHPHLKSVQVHGSRRKMARVDDHKRLPDIFGEKGIEYSEPPIDMKFPIPQMHGWIADPRVRLMTRWNPHDGKYHGFATRPSYRRFCQEVLHEDPTASGGPLDPAASFADDADNDLLCYLDAQFEDELEGMDPETMAEEDQFDQLMDMASAYGLPFDPFGDFPGAELLDEDDEVGSGESYDSLTSESFDYDDDLEDDFDEDGPDSDFESDLDGREGILDSLAYYEWN